MDIIANITGFMTYFAPGYIFISCYDYTACLQRETEKEYLIMKSVSISYLFYVLTSFWGKKLVLDTLEIQATIFIEVFLVGLLAGRAHRMKWVNQLSLCLFDRELANNFFVQLWENADKNNSIVCVTLTMKANLGIYEGQISRISSYNTDPEILLVYYICYDSDMNVVSDYSNTDNVNLLVRYSDIQKFEFELISDTNTNEVII